MSEGWVETTLSDVAQVNPREPALGSDAPFITMADVNEWGVWAAASGPKGTRAGARARAGDTLMARITPCLENGKIAMVPSHLERVGGSTEFIVLRAGDSLLPEFLFHWTCSAQTHHAAVGLMTGTTGRQRVSGSDLVSLPILVPPLSAQRRIVDLMTHLDAHIANLQAERAAANFARDSLVENLLALAGGTEVRLGECLEIARGGSPRPIDDYFTDSPDGLNWIKIGDVPATGKYITKTAQKIRPEGLSKTRRVSAGDFVLSNSMSFGRPYILRIDGCIHDGWLVLSDKGKIFNDDFLYNLLRSRSVQEQFTSLAAGSGVKNLNISVVQTVTVRVPSLDEQQGIAATINEWESLLDCLNGELQSLEVARRDLLVELLAGDTDIPSAYDSLLVGVA